MPGRAANHPGSTRRNSANTNPTFLRVYTAAGVLPMSGASPAMNETKETNMKINLLSAIAATVATLTIATAAYAADGIAASPKVRQALSERNASAPATMSVPTMACEKCTDIRTSKQSPQAKGAETTMGVKQVTTTHGCASCSTKLTVAGEGKAKHQVASHTCSMQTASANSNCCAQH